MKRSTRHSCTAADIFPNQPQPTTATAMNKTMNLKNPPPLTEAEHAEVEAFRTEIRQRPGYHLARVWIEKRELPTSPPTRHPMTVSHIASIIKTATGAALHDETVMTALEDSGIEITGLVRFRNGDISAECFVDEDNVLDVMSQKHHGVLPAPRFQLWSDDIEGPLQ